jgi:hypothetical protein
MKLLDDRTTAVKAYDELLTDPDKRELYKKRAVAMEKIEQQRSTDKQVDATINKTTTSAELAATKSGLKAAQSSTLRQRNTFEMANL